MCKIVQDEDSKSKFRKKKKKRWNVEYGEEFIDLLKSIRQIVTATRKVFDAKDI